MCRCLCKKTKKKHVALLVGDDIRRMQHYTRAYFGKPTYNPIKPVFESGFDSITNSLFFQGTTTPIHSQLHPHNHKPPLMP